MRKKFDRRGVDLPASPGHLMTTKMEAVDMATHAPAVRKQIVRTRLEQLTDIEREKYVIDNVELVGRSYYDERHKAVIAYRRSMDGKLHKFDDVPHLVYGDGGVLPLVGLWDIDGGDNGVSWPSTSEEWAKAQLQDAQVQDKLDRCVDSNRDYDVGLDTLVAFGEHRVLYRKEETTHIAWQVWVPEKLRHLCITIHHEGSAHPGSWRMLQTTRLNFYWPAMRQEITQHCAECRGCALRSKYHR